MKLILQNVKNTKTSEVQWSFKDQKDKGHQGTKGKKIGKGPNSSMFVSVMLFPVSDFILQFAISKYCTSQS